MWLFWPDSHARTHARTHARPIALLLSVSRLQNIFRSLSHTKIKFSMQIYHKNNWLKLWVFFCTIMQFLTDIWQPWDFEQFQLFAFRLLSLRKLNQLITDMTKERFY